MRMPSQQFCRRDAASALVAFSLCGIPGPAPARVTNAPAPELSNSIIASRDTNVSPREIYDNLRSLQPIKPQSILGPSAPIRAGRALDLGAGAGVSTQILWDAGWGEVVAVDASRLAWDRYAAEKELPTGISFMHASDERYLDLHLREGRCGPAEAGAAAAASLPLATDPP